MLEESAYRGIRPCKKYSFTAQVMFGRPGVNREPNVPTNPSGTEQLPSEGKPLDPYKLRNITGYETFAPLRIQIATLKRKSIQALLFTSLEFTSKSGNAMTPCLRDLTEAMRGLLDILAIMAAVASASPIRHVERQQICNGNAALCDRRYSNVSLIGTQYDKWYSACARGMY
ncbi:hypothetical protein AC579_1743 [Pseudocercospora musae]|uniref:Uncharacterized protein n=1 Tax=Pseudocercospora musae TaxID=113226 RepID=A0A139IEN8_9PEZI|nr:hypothetical protein AC579_1743 [Pseudocercospora musae]